MSNKPLMERVIIPRIRTRDNEIRNWFYENDVVECLKKFKESYTYAFKKVASCDKCNQYSAWFYDRKESGELYCFNCWFKECFGEIK